jgi:hypothetical protein
MADQDIVMDSPRKKVAYDPDQDPEEKRVLRQKYRVLLKDEEGISPPHLESPFYKGAETKDNLCLCQSTNLTSMNTQRRSYSKKCSWLTRSSTKVLYCNSIAHLMNFSMKTRPRFPVSAPQEATLDSAFLLTASNMHAAKARAMKAGAGAFDIDDFVSKLITFMGGRRGGGGGGAGPKDRRDRQADADYDEDVDDEEEEEDDEDDEPLNWERIGRKALAKSRRIPVMDFMCVIYHPPLVACVYAVSRAGVRSLMLWGVFFFFTFSLLRRAIGLGR